MGFPLIGLMPLLFIAALLFGPLLMLFFGWRRRAAAYEYVSVWAYLRAIPRNDEERRDAIDMVLKGLVWCLLAILFKPLVLAGVFATFYGARKVLCSLMGIQDDDAELNGEAR